MAEKLKLLRLYLVLLAIVTLGRWLQGTYAVPYDRGHHVFSIVTLTAFAALYYGAFTRRWLGYSLLQAVVLAFLMGVISQLVILLMTMVSYALGLQTYFNYGRALNQPDESAAVPFAVALQLRLGGLVFNAISAGIAGAIGWVAGALLPQRPGASA